jgi:hypothetical protein
MYLREYKCNTASLSVNTIIGWIGNTQGQVNPVAVVVQTNSQCHTPVLLWVLRYCVPTRFIRVSTEVSEGLPVCGLTIAVGKHLALPLLLASLGTCSIGRANIHVWREARDLEQA